MLIDVHGYFYTDRSGRADWRERNQARLSAGSRIGITAHVASILGTWGHTSPTYFPSPADLTHANAAMQVLQGEHPGLVFGYCAVNPNFAEHALEQIEVGLSHGMIGIKLAASRRADDPLLDPIAEAAAEAKVPVLHHVWHHRNREWPGQEASDTLELERLAGRHPDVQFIVAHIGGGGDWAHTLRLARQVRNFWIDISGSGIDVDMMDQAVEAVGPDRLLFGTDVTMGTGWGKLRYLESLGLRSDELERIRSGNAIGIFPKGTFG